MFFYLLTGLFSCTGNPLTGQVVDGTGVGIKDVKIQVVDTTCTAQSDHEGTYGLECTPGNWTLRFEKPGFITHQTDINFSNKNVQTIARQTLIGIPNTTGLFFSEKDGYRPLNQALLNRTMQTQKATLERRYCLQSETAKTTVLPRGKVQIYDRQSKPWRLFLLDDDRCAYTDTRNPSGRWAIGYRNKPTLKHRTLDAELSVYSTVLEPGHYFVAHWDGFFVPKESGSTQYSGFWFQIEG